MTIYNPMRVLRELDMRVPEDIGLAGFDDIPLAARMDPPLTTVRQPITRTGAVAAALIAGAKGLVSSPVTLMTRGGTELKVYFDWDGSEFDNVFLEGDAVLVYQGALEEGALL